LILTELIISNMLIQLISHKMAQLEVQHQPLDHRELHALCLRQEKIVMS